MSEIALLNSGGLDTLAVAMNLYELKHIVHSVYIDIGQPNKPRSMPAASAIAGKYCASHSVMKVFEDDRWMMEVIPGGRNLPWMHQVVFILGAVWAENKGLKYLASGLKNDVTPEGFNESFMAFLKCSKVRDPIIPVRPLSGGEFKIEDIYQRVKHDPLVKKTWSCNSYPACGKCGKCKERKRLLID